MFLRLALGTRSRCAIGAGLFAMYTMIGAPISAQETSARIVGRLDNGFAYLIESPTHYSDRIIIKLVVRAGTAYQKKGEANMAHLIEHEGSMGTKSYPIGSEISRIIFDSSAGDDAICNAFTSAYITQYVCDLKNGGTVDPKKIISFYSEVIRNLDLSDMAIDKQRGTVIAEANGSLANKDMAALRYSITGDKDYFVESGGFDDPSKFSGASVRRFYNKYYSPRRSSLTVVASSKLSEIEESIRQSFSNLSPSSLEDHIILNASSELSTPRRPIQTVQSAVSGNPRVIISTTRRVRVNKSNIWQHLVMRDLLSDLLVDLTFLERSANADSAKYALGFKLVQNTLARFGANRDGLIGEVVSEPNDIYDAKSVLSGYFDALKDHKFSKAQIAKARQRTLEKLQGSGARNAMYDAAMQTGFFKNDQFPDPPSYDRIEIIMRSITDEAVNKYLKFIVGNKPPILTLVRQGRLDDNIVLANRIAKSPSKNVQMFKYAIPERFSVADVPSVTYLDRLSDRIWRGTFSNGLNLVIVSEQSSGPFARLVIFGKGANLNFGMPDMHPIYRSNLLLSNSSIPFPAVKVLAVEKDVDSNVNITRNETSWTLVTKKVGDPESLFGYARIAFDTRLRPRARFEQSYGRVAEADSKRCGYRYIEPTNHPVFEDEASAWLEGFSPTTLVYSGPGDVQEIAKLAGRYVGGLEMRRPKGSEEIEFFGWTFAGVKAKTVDSSEIGDFVLNTFCVNTGIQDGNVRSIVLANLVGAIIRNKSFDILRKREGAVYHVGSDVFKLDSGAGNSGDAILSFSFRSSKLDSLPLQSFAKRVIRDVSEGKFSQVDLDEARNSVRSGLIFQDDRDLSWATKIVEGNSNVTRVHVSDVIDNVTIDETKKFSCQVLCGLDPLFIREGLGS